MINELLTGMTGRTPMLFGVQSDRPSRAEKSTENSAKAPSSMDSISLSEEAQELYKTDTVKKSEKSAENTRDQNGSSDLTEEEQKEVQDLKKRDQEVHTHEQAHMAAGSPYTSAPKYEYTTGPDNKKYATGGSVDVDTSEETTPEKTIEKAQVIKRSAQAPSEPSSQDRNVAAEAARMEQKARAELAASKRQSSSPYGFSQYMKTAAPSSGSMVNLTL